MEPAPATITAVLAMHTGHIAPSSEVSVRPRLNALPVSPLPFSPSSDVGFSLRSRYNRVRGGHGQILMQVSNGRGVTSVAGFRKERSRSAAMTIDFESPDQAEVIALIAELDAYQNSLYPPESMHALDLASLKQPNVLFAVARDDARQAIGCGAIVLRPEFGEVKRMYVSPRGRGQGIARKLLALLESRAIASGCKLLRLETGPYQPEALALYASAGYERRGPFGDYPNDPLSVFMQKHIEA